MEHNDQTIKSVLKCQKQSLDYCDMINQFLEESTERSTTTTSLKSARRRKFDDASQWLLGDWISKLAKGGGAKKIFQYCVNPKSPNQFLYLRPIQGHSGESAVDPALQDNILIPKGFTEYLHHVGNVSDMRSIIRSGLIPGGRSLKRGRQSVFFTVVNPIRWKRIPVWRRLHAT